MKYLWSGEKVNCCAYCEPPNMEECEKCRNFVNAKYPSKAIWLNNTKYVIEDDEVTE